MKIEEEIFQRKKCDTRTLNKAGFQKTETGWFYSEEFMDASFTAEIEIDAKGNLLGRVIDNASEEEYLPVHVEGRIGSYAAKVREAYSEILERIADMCFVRQSFLFPQTNRIAEKIERKYRENMDHPFRKIPDAAVFRYPDNQKWYALIMEVTFSKLTKRKLKKGEDERTVEIINLKADPQVSEKLILQKGFYPSYHMNKKDWISIVLDESVEDDLIMELIDASRSSVIKKSQIRRREGIERWIIPANPHLYDINTPLRRNGEIIWKQTPGMQENDIVYIYMAAPVSAVRYACLITQAGFPISRGRRGQMRTGVKLQLMKEYGDDVCTFDQLRKLGIRAVRGARRVTAEFIDYMEL